MKKEKEKASEFDKKVRKLAALKKRKYGLDYFSDSEEYRSYALYRSVSVGDYMQYRHYASFHGLPVLAKDDLFKWYRMFFEMKADMTLSQDSPPTKEGYAKSIPESSAKWTKKQLAELRRYVENWENPLTGKND